MNIIIYYIHEDCKSKRRFRLQVDQKMLCTGTVGSIVFVGVGLFIPRGIFIGALGLLSSHKDVLLSASL